MVAPGATVIDVPGCSIGHATDAESRTGTTVIVFDRPALTAVEVRGAAPGTRELDLLGPGKTVQRADAIVLTGGSAFGLASADGVVRALAAAGRGFPTPVGGVPIVPAAVLFDLAVGKPNAPDQAFGKRAFANAAPISRSPEGAAGAGTGATWGKILGQRHVRPGGLGIAQQAIGDRTVTAVAITNAFGVVGVPQTASDDARGAFLAAADPADLGPGKSTTLVAIVTNVACDHDALIRCCVAAHDAMARTIVPAHTALDGDVAFASTLEEGSIALRELMRLAIATELAVEAAIRRSITMT